MFCTLKKGLKLFFTFAVLTVIFLLYAGTFEQLAAEFEWGHFAGEKAGIHFGLGDGGDGGTTAAGAVTALSSSNFSFIQVKTPSNVTLRDHFSVCLASQTTIDRLETIPRLAAYWRGPVELIVFLRAVEELQIATRFLEYLSVCGGQVDGDGEDWYKSTVAVQIAFDNDTFLVRNGSHVTTTVNLVKDAFGFKAFSSSDSVTEAKVEELEPNLHDLCSLEPDDMLKSLVDIFLPAGPDPKFVYPQNHMRNHAKHSCSANYEWVTVLDVDIIPKWNAAAQLQEFWESNEAKPCDKCAFVMPVFEIAKPCHYPRTKRELVAMTKNGTAVPFHFGFWKPAHQATDYPKWNKTHLHETPVKISHKANYGLSVTSLKDKRRHNTYFYEPFYISHASIPDYEKRFLGFGFTRSSQTLSALVAGWNFQILTPIFVTHCGIQPQVAKGAFKTVPRYQQVAANGKIYREFVDEKLREFQGNKYG